jgi:hypothetical protein
MPPPPPFPVELPLLSSSDLIAAAWDSISLDWASTVLRKSFTLVAIWPTAAAASGRSRSSILITSNTIWDLFLDFQICLFCFDLS